MTPIHRSIHRKELLNHLIPKITLKPSLIPEETLLEGNLFKTPKINLIYDV